MGFILATVTVGCTIARVGQTTDGRRWVWIAGLPSKVDTEGVSVDNRIVSIAIDSVEVEK